VAARLTGERKPLAPRLRAKGLELSEIGRELNCSSSAARVAVLDRGELGVPVSDEELDGMESILQHHRQVPRLLDNPGTGRMSGDSGHMHPSGVELDEEQHVEASMPACCFFSVDTVLLKRRLGVEELRPGQTTPHR